MAGWLNLRLFGVTGEYLKLIVHDQKPSGNSTPQTEARSDGHQAKKR
jgi:hypothetical protein